MKRPSRSRLDVRGGLWEAVGVVRWDAEVEVVMVAVFRDLAACIRMRERQWGRWWQQRRSTRVGIAMEKSYYSIEMYKKNIIVHLALY